MKRKLLNQSFLKQTAVAVPAAALMLGAAHGGTIGFNLDSYYYDNQAINGVYVRWTPGATPAPDGFGLGYQTSGWVVTAKAFGVVPADWGAAPVFAWWQAGSSAVDVIATKGGISAQFTAPHCFESGIGTQKPTWVPETVAPGNDQVTYTALMWLEAAGTAPSVSLSGLAARYPNGYVVQTIAAWRGSDLRFNGVTFTGGASSTHSDYAVTYNRPAPSDGANGTIGLSAPSGTFTSDTLVIACDAQTPGSNSVLSALVITDKPVITRSYPANTLSAVGGWFVLSASVVGIGTMSYQWQHAGTNLPGATFVNYTNSSAATADTGNYQLIVTGSRFPSSPAVGDVLVVSVVPPHAARNATWDANTSTTSAQDGSGTWSYTLTNWWSGSVDDYWGAPDSAIFGVGGAGPYTVTLGDNIKANAITFNSGGYTITNSSHQTLTLSSAAGITAKAAATIGAPLLTGTNILLKAGTGALTLAGGIQSTQTVVMAGSLEVLAKLGDSPYVVTNGATLKIGYSPGDGYANTAMQIYGDGAAATTGFYLKGGQNYNCSGQIQLLNAPTTIRQYGTGLAGLGTFDINYNGILCTAAASGSVIETNIQMVSRGYGMSAQIDAGANTATGDLIINGPLNISAAKGVYGLVKRGTGSVRLNAPGTVTNCQLDLRAGSAICGGTNVVGVNGRLNLRAGATFDLNGISQRVTNATLAGTLKMTINKSGNPKSSVLTVTDPNTAFSFGGDLVVTNLGGALAIGDTFTLFSNLGGSGFSGAFATLSLPALGGGQAWQDNTAVDGTIKVITGAVAPAITLQPVDRAVILGQRLSLTVTAIGTAPLTHRWFKDGVALSDSGTLSGTSSSNLVITAVQSIDAGGYTVVISNTEAFSEPPMAGRQWGELAELTR
ncbi:MAG: immunoglobulin domain-containing protein [Verrucomicrobia bacterium]|nr:immunoglobulin domain-containing protein [Verrucomicrobiota bacterium]